MSVYLDKKMSDSVELLRAERDQLRAQLEELEQRLAQAQEDLGRATNERSALYMTSLDITSQLDLQHTLSSILRRAVQLSAADLGDIALLDEDTGELVISAAMNVLRDVVGTRLRPGEGLAGDVLQSGRNIIIENYQTYASRAAKFDDLPLYASAGFPLRWQGRIIGVLSLHRQQPDRPFSLDDLDNVQHLIVQATIAINNAQIYTQELARNRQLATLYQAVTRIAGSLNLDDVLRSSAEALIAALSLPMCIIYELKRQPDPNVLAAYVTGHMGIEPIPDPVALTLPRQTRSLLDEGAWLVFQRNDPRLHPQIMDYMARDSRESILLVPLTIGQRTIGLVEMSTRSAPVRFRMTDIETAQALAAHISVAIRHAQLHHEVQARRLNEQAVLLKLTRRLVETTEQRQVAEQTVQAVAEAFDTQFVNLVLNEGYFYRSWASLGYDRDALDKSVWESGEDSSIGYAAQTRELVIIEDTLTETRFTVHPFLPQNGIRSALVAPMIFNNRVIGVISVGRFEPGGFTAADAKLLAVLAYQTAVALDRARLFEQTEAYASDLELLVDERLREIRAQKERTETILQATGEALIVFDQNDRIERVNRAFETQHQCSAELVIGKTSIDIFGFDICAKARLLETENIWRGELQVPRRDGQVYDAAATISRVVTATGEQHGIVVSLRDISYLKELDRMKDRFVSSVSHELRTPLANIKLYQHLLVNGFENRREQYLATLQRETERLQRLIEDLLLLSRMDTDTVLPNLKLTDLNAVVRTLIDDRAQLVAQRKLELQTDFCPGELPVFADENLIGQAVTNLVQNAMNYTPSGGKITVSTGRERVDDTEMVYVSVADTGLGMTPEDQERLFDRFFRGTAARSTSTAGTGLGMPIVREIMGRHNGKVSFKSEPGQGTVFYLFIPAAAEIQPANSDTTLNPM